MANVRCANLDLGKQDLLETVHKLALKMAEKLIN